MLISIIVSPSSTRLSSLFLRRNIGCFSMLNLGSSPLQTSLFFYEVCRLGIRNCENEYNLSLNSKQLQYLPLTFSSRSFLLLFFFRFPAISFFGSEESRLCCDFPCGERRIELPEGEFDMMMFKDVNSCLQVNVVCVEKGSGSLVVQRDFTLFLQVFVFIC